MSNAATPTEFAQAVQFFEARNYPQAELYLRRHLKVGGTDPAAAALMQRLSSAYGLSEAFRLSERSSPEPGAETRHLMIKAWGYGFWSDVHHVLGQLLVAELTHRTPVIQWGSNSLFRDGSLSNAFEHFFEPISNVNLSPRLSALSIYPPKWTPDNLHTDNVNKWSGPYSRQAAQFSFSRQEDLVVSDFYTTVSSLLPWIAKDSRYFGMSDAEIYTDLFSRYLKPLPRFHKRVEAFIATHMAGRSWVAVHVRGSDKVRESATLHDTNQGYFAFVDRIIDLNPGIGVFLLTDAVDIHAEFSRRYADRLVTTPALRSNSSTGVHLLGHSGVTVGEEVLVDALLATRCDYFVGNKESNVSVAIASMKPWPKGFLAMLGQRDIRAENLYLHGISDEDLELPAPPVPTPEQQAEPCRLCGSPTQDKFDLAALDGHRVRYAGCTSCGSLQTVPAQWPVQTNASIAEVFDTGKASRTLSHFLALPPLLEALGVRKTDLAVDCGGGSGLMGRLMRDAGYNFHTCDPLGGHEFMAGFVWTDIVPRCRVVTLFEIAGQFANPAESWQRVFASDPDWVIGSTALYGGQGADWTPLQEASAGQRFFYSAAGLARLAGQFGRTAYDLGTFFLITRHALDPVLRTAVSQWRNALGLAQQSTLAAWSRAPQQRAGTDRAELLLYESLRRSGKCIALDGTYFRFASGIVRVWKSLLGQWSASALAPSLVVIDRGRTAPRLPGIRYVDAPLTDFLHPENDREMLQGICDREGVGLFVSTYYTIPLTTPSALLVLDMIPEVMGFDLTQPQWVGKHAAIGYADAFLSISHSTEHDLVRLFPKSAERSKAVAHCGCDFRTPAPPQVDDFKVRHGIARPYFMLSGSLGDYKNTMLFFEAFARLGDVRSQLAIVCTNANRPLSAEYARHVGGAQLHSLVLSDDDLQCAYSGALALAYPSRYEGFGLPVAEAMACSCPVITCRNSSLQEVGAQAVRYVDPDSVDEMHQALIEVQQPALRAAMVRRGLEQAVHFSWAKMAGEVGQKLAGWALELPGRDRA